MVKWSGVDAVHAEHTSQSHTKGTSRRQLQLIKTDGVIALIARSLVCVRVFVYVCGFLVDCEFARVD